MTLSDITVSNKTKRSNPNVFVEVDLGVLDNKLHTPDSNITGVYKNCKGYFYTTIGGNKLKSLYLHPNYKYPEDGSRKILFDKFNIHIPDNVSVRKYNASNMTFKIGSSTHVILFCEKHSVYYHRRRNTDPSTISCPKCKEELSTKISKKAYDTQVSKYGAKRVEEYFSKSPLAQKNSRATFMAMDDEEKREKCSRGSVKNFYNGKSKYTSSTDFELLGEYKGVWNTDHTRRRYTLRCKKCGNTYETTLHNTVCRKCNPYYHKSESVIRDITGGVRYRDKYEIDSFIKDLNIGFEYNGVFFHSVNTPLGGSDKRYHQTKSLFFANKGVSLVHIYEDQWVTKRGLIESMINVKMGKADRVYARKCDVAPISSKESYSFLEHNHLYGGKHTSIRLSLVYNSEIVSVLTIRDNGHGRYEIDRFASAMGVVVVGGFSKLLKHFEREYNPTQVFSYSDMDWCNIHTNSVYYKNGFDFVGVTDPSFYWIDPSTMARYSRNAFQKHKLSKKFPSVYSDDKTADEIMTEVGYFKLYTSGNLKFKKEYT